MLFRPGEERSVGGEGIPVHTRRGSRIPTLRKLPRGPAIEHAGVGLHQAAGRILRSVDSTYNCVGLVFAGRRTWIEPDHLTQILSEDGYSSITEAMAMEGDVVAYTRDDGSIPHVGLIVSKQPVVELARWSITVLSKWGQDGEYLHDLRDYPTALSIGGRITPRFWSERKALT